MKLINDTLKSKEGIWSLKRVLAVASFIFSLTLGVFIVISDKILKTSINIYAVEIFNSLLLFTASTLGIVEFGKKFLNKKEEDGTVE